MNVPDFKLSKSQGRFAAWAHKIRLSGTAIGDALLWVLVLVGLILCLRQYAIGASLWMDEAYIGLNILGRDFFGLINPLAYNQAAPLGYLWLLKLCTHLPISEEFALRLPSILCVTAALVLAPLVARRYLTMPSARAFFVGALALNPLVIRFASQVKPYALDLLVGMILLLLWFEAGRDRRLGWLLLVGSTAPWFSFPSVFLLAGVGGSLILKHALARDYRKATGFLLKAGAWFVSFAILYFLSIARVRESASEFFDSGQSHLMGGFMPFPPFTQNWFSWLIFALEEAGQSVTRQMAWWTTPLPFLGTVMIVLIVCLAIVGLFRRGTDFALLAILTAGCFLAASALQIYPVQDRLLLFAVPLLTLLCAIGMDWGSRINPALLWIAAAGLLFAPATASARRFFAPVRTEEIREPMAFLAGKIRQGDTLFVLPQSVPAFRFYNLRFKLKPVRVIESAPAAYDQSAYMAEMDALNLSGRVWFLSTSRLPLTAEDFSQPARSALDSRGRKVDEFRGIHAGIELYEITQSQETPD